MKTLISRLVSRFIISQIKKGAIDNMTVQRLLIYFTALQMQKMGKSHIEITYEHEELESNFVLDAKLASKKEQ